jgi:hypothetical protein
MSVNLRTVETSNQLELLARENPELQQLLAIYPEEHAAKILNNKDKLKKLIKSFGHIYATTSVNALVMTCTEQCPYSSICIFRKNEMDPVGSPCPVEKKIIMQMEAEIVAELDIERDNPIEMEMLWDLVDTKLLDMRASAKLKDGQIIQIIESTVGKASTTKEDIAPAISLKIDLKRLKHSIIDSFVATRRAKKKYGMQSDSNTIEEIIKNAAITSGE